MQYQQGSMHSLANMRPDQYNSNRNTGSNSIRANTNNYGGYSHEQSYSSMYNNNPKEDKVYWDQDTDYYNQRAKFDKYERGQEFKTTKDVYERELEKSRERSQVSYRTKNQGFYEKSNNGPQSQNNKEISKIVPMKIRTPNKQDSSTNLRVSIFNTERNNPNNSASITINITDDSNALFLWRFYITESDYPNLKEQQSLKVDFGGFIGMILQILGDCESDESKQAHLGISPRMHSHPQLYAVLNIDKNKEKAQLKIIQTNKFKESQHLLLFFIKASDEQLKEYLSEKYTREKNQNNRLNIMISQLQTEIASRKVDEEQMAIELKNLKRNSADTIEQLQRRQKDKIETLERRIEDKFLKQKQEYIQEQQRIVDNLKMKLEQQKQQYEELQKSHQNANKKTITLQTSSSSLQNQHILLQTKYSDLQQQLAVYKTDYEKLSKEHGQLVAKNMKNEYQLTSSQEKNKQRAEEIEQLKKKLEKNSEQLQFSQGQNKQLTGENQSLRKNIETKLQEIDELKDRIEEWRAKYEKKKKKNGTYIQVIEKQQAQIEKQEMQIRKLQGEINFINDSRERLEKTIKDKDSKIQELEKQVEEGKLEIQNHKSIITQFHKQANSNRFATGGFSSTSPSMGNAFLTSSSTSIKDYSPYSQSRIKLTGGTYRQTSPLNEKIPGQRVVPPPIKKYRQPSGLQNQRNRENSKSPITNKLSQEQDPEEADKTKQKIGPIKFRK